MKRVFAKHPTAVGGVEPDAAIQREHTNKEVLMPSGMEPTDDALRTVIGDYTKGDQTQLWRVSVARRRLLHHREREVRAGHDRHRQGERQPKLRLHAKSRTLPTDAQLVVASSAVPNIKDATKVFGKASGKLWAVNARGTDPGTPVVIWPDAAPKIENAHMFGFLPPK